VSLGADLFWTDGELDERTRYVSGAFTRIRIAEGRQLYRGLYLTDVFTPAAGWTVLAGGRLDFWRNYNGARSELDIATGNVLVDSAFEPHSDKRFSYNLGLRHNATARFSWHTNVHTAFRAPSLNELYKSGRESGNVTIESNALLTAERLLGAEAGFDYTRGVVTTRVTGFWTRLENPIVDFTVGVATGGTRSIPPCGTITVGGACRQRRNLGEARSYGVESELEVRPRANWLLAGSWVWNPTEVTKAPGQEQVVGKAARGVAEHAVTVRAEIMNPRVADVALITRWVDSRFDDDLNVLLLESFLTVDMRLAKRVGQWETFAGIENIFGDEYDISKAANGKVRVGAPRLLQAGVKVQW
jgi:outer membrane receptor protein involved in Fe transport